MIWALKSTHNLRSHWPIISLSLLVVLLHSFIVFVLTPSDVFLVNDNGVKFLQARSLLENQWQSFAVVYPGADLDPDDVFSPLLSREFFYRGKNGDIYGIYSDLFSILTAFAYQWLDVSGIYLLGVLSAGALSLAIYYLYWSLSGKYSLLPSIIICFASPIVFYTIDLWEYTPTIFLSTLGLALVFDGLRPSAVWWKIPLGGLMLAIAVWLRAELYFMLLAVGLSILWVKRSLRPVILFGLSATPIILLLWQNNLHHSGTIMGGHVRTALEVVLLIGEDRGPYSAVLWFLPLTNARWMISLGIIFVGWALLILTPQQYRSVGTVILTVISVLLIGANVTYEIFRPWQPISLVGAFPMVLLLLLSIPRRVQIRDAADAYQLRLERSVLLIVFIFFICAFVSVTGKGFESAGDWGPRYLLSTFPLISVLIVLNWQRLCDQNHFRGFSRSILIASFFALLCFSGLVQLQGIRLVRAAKLDYAEMLAASRASEPIIVTDIWWFAHMNASNYFDKIFLMVNYGSNGSFDQLLSIFEENNIESFTFVTTSNRNVARGELPSRDDWKLVANHTEQIWLDLKFMRYQRSSNQSASSRSSIS